MLSTTTLGEYDSNITHDNHTPALETPEEQTLGLALNQPYRLTNPNTLALGYIATVTNITTLDDWNEHNPNDNDLSTLIVELTVTPIQNVTYDMQLELTVEDPTNHELEAVKKSTLNAALLETPEHLDTFPDDITFTAYPEHHLTTTND